MKKGWFQGRVKRLQDELRVCCNAKKCELLKKFNEWGIHQKNTEPNEKSFQWPNLDQLQQQNK